jgi:hypothetical protein
MDNIFLRTLLCASRAGLFPKHENPKAITSKSHHTWFSCYRMFLLCPSVGNFPFFVAQPQSVAARPFLELTE